MKAFCVFLFVGAICALVESGIKGDNLLKMSTTATITPTPEGFQSTFGIVPGSRSCGGPAEVIDWRYESCTDDSKRVCQIPSDGRNRDSEFTFVPSEAIPDGLVVRFNVSADGVPTRVYDINIPNSAVRGGSAYTVRTAGSSRKEFFGKTMTFQYNIIRRLDSFVEACSEAEFQNV